MATTVASILPLPASTTTPAAVITTRQTNANGAEFQNILTDAQNQARPAAAATTTDAARDAGRAADAAEADRLAREQADAATQLTAAEANAAALAVQTAPVPQLAADNTPLQTTPDLLPTGTTATDAQALTSPELTGIANRAAAQAAQLTVPQAEASEGRAPGVPTTRPQANPAPVPAQPPVTPPVPPVAAQEPTPAAQQQPLASAVTATQPGQRLVVPTVAPTVPNPAAVPTADAGATLTQTPTVEPEAAVGAAALPDVNVGGRPNTAGERFAALASLADTLKPAAAPTNTPFSAELAAPAGAPLQAFRGVRFAPEGPARETAEAASPAPAAPTAPAAVNSPNAPAAPSAPRAVNAVPAPDPAFQVADNIVVHAKAVVHAGKTEFQMRLDPPELGAVRVRLTSDGDSIQAQVVVSNDAIRRMIESQLPELRQRLEQAGVSVQNFDVATDPNSGSGDGRGPAGDEAAPAVTGADRPSLGRFVARMAARAGLPAGALDVIA